MSTMPADMSATPTEMKAAAIRSLTVSEANFALGYLTADPAVPLELVEEAVAAAKADTARRSA